MPSGAAAKRVLLLGAILLAALFIAGLITGAIGAAFYKSEDERQRGS